MDIKVQDIIAITGAAIIGHTLGKNLAKINKNKIDVPMTITTTAMAGIGLGMAIWKATKSGS